MTTTLATKPATDNSPGALRLAMAEAAHDAGMGGADSFEQFLIGRGNAVERLKTYLRALMKHRQFGRARTIADQFNAIVEDLPVESVDAVLHPAAISDAAEECAESAYRLHKDRMSRRRLIADKEKEVSDGLRLIRALKAEDAAEAQAGGQH
jgi:hypothetical protein